MWTWEWGKIDSVEECDGAVKWMHSWVWRKRHRRNFNVPKVKKVECDLYSDTRVD